MCPANIGTKIAHIFEGLDTAAFVAENEASPQRHTELVDVASRFFKEMQPLLIRNCITQGAPFEEPYEMGPVQYDEAVKRAQLHIDYDSRGL